MTASDSKAFLSTIRLILTTGALLVAPLFVSAQTFDNCIKYALDESFPKIAVGEKSRFFVKCNSEKSTPEDSQPRPRYSDHEVKSLSRAFEAVTDCLETEPQWLFPKLMMESGFHVLIQNPNGDAGIGQLTGKAITDVDQVLPQYKNTIFKSSRKSCQWLKATTQYRSGFWEPVAGKSKCALMTKSSNPIRNLLYAGIFHKLNEQYVNNEFAKRNIPALLTEAGYPSQDFTRLKKILVTLGYNTGGAVAVKNLQDFLFSRVDFVRRKSQEFNIQLLTSLNHKEKQKALSYVNESDFDFKEGLSNFYKRKQDLKVQLQQSNRQLSDQDVELAARRLLRNVSASQYTFPEWLLVWQSHGGPGYVSSLASFSLKIEKRFGPGVCSNSENYRVNGEL